MEPMSHPGVGSQPTPFISEPCGHPRAPASFPDRPGPQGASVTVTCHSHLACDCDWLGWAQRASSPCPSPSAALDGDLQQLRGEPRVTILGDRQTACRRQARVYVTHTRWRGLLPGAGPGLDSPSELILSASRLSRRVALMSLGRQLRSLPIHPHQTSAQTVPTLLTPVLKNKPDSPFENRWDTEIKETKKVVSRTD